MAIHVRVTKAAKPLRYRISPVEAKLDELDKLEAEFKRQAVKDRLEAEEVETYQRYLDVQRESLTKRRDKALGIKAEPECIDLTNVSDLPKTWRWYLAEHGQMAFKLGLAFVVVFWIYLKNSG